MNLYLAFDSNVLHEKAKELSVKLKLDIFKDYSSKYNPEYEDDYFLVCSAERIFLQKGLKNTSKPIYSNFDDWIDNYDDRLLRRTLKGLPNNFSCVDLTAGFGKDAFEIAKSERCLSLVLIEKEKWVFSILKDGLKKVNDYRVIQLLSKIRVHNLDNLEYLNHNNDFDLIYIDPMFQGVYKSKAKKHMQALRDLSSSENDKNLLKNSLEKANHRVVVKRHKNMEYLEGIKTSTSIEGKVVRFDLYNLK